MIGVSKTFGGSSILSSPVSLFIRYLLEALILLERKELTGWCFSFQIDEVTMKVTRIIKAAVMAVFLFYSIYKYFGNFSMLVQVTL